MIYKPSYNAELSVMQRGKAINILVVVDKTYAPKSPTFTSDMLVND